jgi:glycosyltransferase involved in cell wall biosynthesis
MLKCDNDRIPLTPPVISPVADDYCPLWSVMIPTYNCAEYLQETLVSVLSHDPGPELMQIEVIDDASTDADVETLINNFFKGRVKYFRQPFNVGSLRNFETCLNRSKGKWIHLLHGDDYVKPDFYNEIRYLFDSYPEVGAAFTNHLTINPNGDEEGRMRELSDGPMIIDDFLERIAKVNFIQPPAMVVKREVYEQLGGYFGVHYGEDWEMWARIGSRYKVAYSPKRLATYRSHANNISDLSHSSSQSVIDINKVINTIENYLPEGKKNKLKNVALKNFSIFFSHIAHQLYNKHSENKPAIRMGKKAISMHTNSTTLYQFAALNIKILTNWKFLRKRLKYIYNFFLSHSISDKESLVSNHVRNRLKTK